jgi:hypothetical protein
MQMHEEKDQALKYRENEIIRLKSTIEYDKDLFLSKIGKRGRQTGEKRSLFVILIH